MSRQTARLIATIFLILVLALVYFCQDFLVRAPRPLAADGIQLCFWNVENLFDDRSNPDAKEVDRDLDQWFSGDRRALDLKLDNLSRALAAMNSGRGPDIVALVEVESLRAAELLRKAMNRRLADPALHYDYVVLKDVGGGRTISPALISRLPLQPDHTRLHGSRLRILETHVAVQGHDLTIMVTHWTARTSDPTGRQRAKYADQIYGAYRAMAKRNPAVDFLVCGDFNDPPSAASVSWHLQATEDRPNALETGSQPRLFNPFAGLERSFATGTHYYDGRWSIFDQIIISPGLLDRRGWSCDLETVRIADDLARSGDREGRPWRFGGRNYSGSRGYSDHFPVTVKLRVEEVAMQ